MPSITSWTRLEPKARGGDTQSGLEARVEDPLWLLGRQWQLGEFRGDDAGSAVVVRLEADGFRLTRYRRGPLPTAGATTAEPYDDRVVPLETVVEREVASRSPAADPRWAADTGREFARLLGAAAATARQVPAYLARYALALPPEADRAALDAASLSLLTVLAGRVIDGGRLYADLDAAVRPPSGTPALPAQPPIPARDRPRVLEVARTWLAWYDALVSQPGAAAGSWVPERMEYEFAVGAPTPGGQVVLTAPEYVEGRLDWYAFRHRQAGSVGPAGGEVRRDDVRQTTIPVPVTFPGMPANRWWEFEDARINFGAVDTGPDDLLRMMLIEFALIYGNDWFVIPVELSVGTVCRIRSLTVATSFGETIAIPPFHQAGGTGSAWRMFTLIPEGTTAAGRQDLLLVPPVLGPSLHGRPVEEVLLFRDEMANMAWAVERIVPGRSGRPIDRHDAYYARNGRDPEGARARSGQRLEYRLASTVPDYWVPLVPVPFPAGGPGAIRLHRGVIPDPVTQEVPRPRGQLLGTGPLAINDEEVPRAGARVTRAYQYARWIDGSTHLWLGRRKEAGRGEGGSGLRFDTVE